MFLWVSQSLREVIVEDWNLDERTVERLITDAGKRSWKDTDMAEDRLNKAQKLAASLDEQGLLTQESMMRILRNGDVALFISMSVALPNWTMVSLNGFCSTQEDGHWRQPVSRRGSMKKGSG